MIVMEDVWPGHEYVLQSAFAIGLLGAVLLNLGMRSKNEVSATWLGFWAGTFLWTGWVEFAFVWSGNYLGVPDLMDPNNPGEIATKAEYLVMMSSVGVLGATLAYFLMNPETKCNFFLWFQRNMKLSTGAPTKGHNATLQRSRRSKPFTSSGFSTWYCCFCTTRPLPGKNQQQPMFFLSQYYLGRVLVPAANEVLESNYRNTLWHSNGDHRLEYGRADGALEPVRFVLGKAAGFCTGNDAVCRGMHYRRDPRGTNPCTQEGRIVPRRTRLS